MATYVVSDIHGCYSAFQSLLDKIQFDSELDELIIAGDIIDRGQENYQMLEYAASKPKNVTFLMGNHDYGFIEYTKELLRLYSSKKVPEDVTLQTLVRNSSYNYLFHNNVLDHYDTIRKLIMDKKHPVTLDDFRRWKNIIKKFPYYVKRTICEKEYIIVHAGYISEDDYARSKFLFLKHGLTSLEMFYMWARNDAVYCGGIPGATVVSGHTPTIADTLFFNDGKACRIEYGDRTFIDIDCGYVFHKTDKNANLACLRLEDESVVYLNKQKSKKSAE